MKNNWLVFTDLDGTLLDFDTYDFSRALPAIDFLKKEQIPIIPCTSKTIEEVRELRKKLGLHDPFIVENGSAILFEANYFPENFEARSLDGLKAVILGKPRNEILTFFKEFKKRFALNVKGFSEMNVEEICRLTRLSEHEARLAGERKFSEPMVSFEQTDLLSRKELIEFVQHHGYRLLRGNRFYHLIGHCDKGQAVKKLTQMFEKAFGKPFKTMGLGDSKNDLEMLKVVNQPIIIRKKDGNFVHLEGILNLYVSQQAGPAGWAEAVLKFLKFN